MNLATLCAAAGIDTVPADGAAPEIVGTASMRSLRPLNCARSGADSMSAFRGG
mgnify:CR=1 FL=1